MSTTQIANEPATTQSAAKKTETKLEVVVIPVSDVERAKRFYQGLGWRLDADFSAGDEWRGSPADASRLTLLHHLRQRIHVSGSRLSSGNVPRRR